jgi:hypothetical protein
MNLYSDNINIVTPQCFSFGLQQRVDRLQKDANRLFSLGNIRKRCQMALMSFFAHQQPSPYADWGMQLSHDREFRFAQSLTQSYTSTKEEIILWANGCMSEYLLQEVMEERERRIEEFSRMRIASRWYQMKDDDQWWRVFAQNIPFGVAGREGEIKEFFELLDKICILTDILNGHASEYGLEVDYTHLPRPCDERHETTVVEAIQAQTEALMEIVKMPKQQFTVYPQAGSTANVGCQMQSPEFKMIPPSQDQKPALESDKKGNENV